MYKYKLKDDAKHLEGTFVPGVGVVKDGVLTSGRHIENPNFELIQDAQVTNAPQHINGVVPQATQPVVPPVAQPETVQQPVNTEQNQQTAPESESQS